VNSRTRPSFWRAYARLSDLNRLRAIGERHGDTIIWVWIGTHNEFDNLFG
jgi:hypothetical protein